MSLSILQLLPAIVLPSVIVNLLQWRLDLKNLNKLAAFPKSASPLEAGRGEAPRVSFLIAAWNEESRLRRCIDAVLRLRYPGLEIVLCAGGTDCTWKIAFGIKDPRVILLEQKPGDGKQKSLRRCLERATGDIIYLLDADCLINEAAFASMLGPLMSGAEQAVCCSPCRPVAEQLGSPFVLSQCACRTYTSIHQPEHGLGLSGANAAMTRTALECAGGFSTDADPGGDYDLGKRLLRSGTQILHLTDAAVSIEFHSHVGPYLRQQARWLRNVVIHGMRFHAYDEVAMCICTSLVGLMMLVTPCLWLFAVALSGLPVGALSVLAALWAASFLHAFLSRLRYFRSAAAWLGMPFPGRVIALLPVFLLVDFLAWAIPLGQYPAKLLPKSWVIAPRESPRARAQGPEYLR